LQKKRLEISNLLRLVIASSVRRDQTPLPAGVLGAQGSKFARKSQSFRFSQIFLATIRAARAVSR